MILAQDLKSQIRYNKLITMGDTTDGLTPVDQSKLKLSSLKSTAAGIPAVISECCTFTQKNGAY